MSEQDKKIIDYQILRDSFSFGSDCDLPREVKELLKQGWQPYGSPLVVCEAGDILFYQAMVKYDDSMRAALQKILNICREPIQITSPGKKELIQVICLGALGDKPQT